MIHPRAFVTTGATKLFLGCLIIAEEIRENGLFFGWVRGPDVLKGHTDVHFGLIVFVFHIIQEVLYRLFT